MFRREAKQNMKMFKKILLVMAIVSSICLLSLSISCKDDSSGEPTAALGIRESRKVRELIKMLKDQSGISIIIINHKK